MATRTRNSFRNMWQRCTNPKSSGYKCYGGRGITVCPEWKSFSAFYADMGSKPKGHELDRIDNSKGYYKENCRWLDVTRSHEEQGLVTNGTPLVETDESKAFIARFNW